MSKQFNGTFSYRNSGDERLEPLSEPKHEGNGDRQPRLSSDLKCLSNSSLLQAISLDKQSQSRDLSDLVGPLAGMLLSGLSRPEWECRVEAIQAIVLWGKQAPPEILEALGQALFDTARPVRKAAAEVMREVGGKAQKNALRLAMEDPEWTVRVPVVQALGSLGKDAPIGALVHALKDEDESVRVAAVWALVGLGVEILTQPLEESDEIMSWSSWEQGKRTPLHALKSVLFEDEVEIVRLAVVEALGKLGNQAPRELIVLALRDEDELVRAAAAKALGSLGERTLIEPLIFKLKDENEMVRFEVATALGRVYEQLHSQLSREFLLHLLEDENEDVQALAAWALGEQGEQASLEPLAFALENSSERVQLVIAWAIEQICERATLEAQGSTFVDVCDSNREVTQELKMLDTQNPVESLLMRLIDFVEDKKGFVTAEVYNEEILVLSCGYEKDEKPICDVLSGLQGGSVQVERLEDALSGEDEVVRGFTSQVAKRLRKRPWTEAFIVSLDIDRNENISKQDLPAKVVASFVGYNQVRFDDLSIRQSADIRFGKGRYRFLDEKVNAWIDRWESHVPSSSLHLQNVRLWYGSAASLH